MSTWVHPAGTAAHDGWDVRLPAGAELSYAGVAVRTLSPGERLELVPDGTERMLVPLDGAVEARVDGSTHVLGRAGDVMEAAPDVLYLPIDRRCDLRARDAGCRLLIASAPADEVHAVQLLPARDIPDPQALAIRSRINGVTMQDSNTKEMIWSVAEMISDLSRSFTLLPGDIIATGTPLGVGSFRTPPVRLQDGDVMEIEVENIGVLVNTCRVITGGTA